MCKDFLSFRSLWSVSSRALKERERERESEGVGVLVEEKHGSGAVQNTGSTTKGPDDPYSQNGPFMLLLWDG